MRLFSRLSLLIAFLIAPIVVAFETIVSWVSVPDHRTSIDIDNLRREASAETVGRHATIKSFMSRALEHARFIGGQFMPGRSPSIV